MSNLKCPFCQQELKELYNNGVSVGFRCKNKNCPETNIMCGTKALWQELIRTRKALDVAVDGLLTVWRATDHTTKQGSIAYNVLCDLNIKPLDRIKALEQKDAK